MEIYFENIFRTKYYMFNNPEKDWELMLSSIGSSPPNPTLFD